MAGWPLPPHTCFMRDYTLLHDNLFVRTIVATNDVDALLQAIHHAATHVVDLLTCTLQSVGDALADAGCLTTAQQVGLIQFNVGNAIAGNNDIFF